jgi:hypothetical protein
LRAGRGSQRASVGTTHGIHILAIVILLLVVREVYLTITVGKIQHEPVWYPLAALTELIAVCFFSVPGLVPQKGEQDDYINNKTDETLMT